MAVLLTADDNITVDVAGINQCLQPVMVWPFVFTTNMQCLVDAGVMRADKQAVFESIGESDRAYCKLQQVIPTKVAEICYDPDDARAIASMQPHINPGSEVHFCLAGSLILYFMLPVEDGPIGPQRLVLQSGDRLFIPGGIEHWIDFTSEHTVTLASFHSEDFASFHAKVRFTADD